MALKSRISDFKSRFQQLLGGGNQGYEELDTLERPLVEQSEDEEDHEHGRQGYRPPQSEGNASFTIAQTGVPSVQEELQLMSALAREASEILWEMVAMGSSGAEVAEVKGRAEMLQKQLRGMIGDFAEGDEACLAQALEALDMLNRCLDDQAAAPAPAPPPQADQAPPPVSTSAPMVSQQTDAPLISFD